MIIYVAKCFLSLEVEGFKTQELLWAFCSVVFTRRFPNHILSLFQDHNLARFCCSETLKTEERLLGAS